LKILKSSL